MNPSFDSSNIQLSKNSLLTTGRTSVFFTQTTEQEARQVVRSLCQGTVDEQRRTLDRFFTPDFSFVHPFCAVPSFAERRVPVLGFRVSSRHVVRSIFQWYRMLSPTIEIEIDSVCKYC